MAALPSPRTPPAHRSARPVDGTGSPDGALVQAVLVACDGQQWLPAALAAVAAQTRLPDQFLAVDAGSRDASAALLAGAPALALPPLAVHRRSGFLDAVRAALATADAQALTQAPAGAGRRALAPRAPGPRWVWLLHDDCAPEPGALEALLAAVEVAPSVGIAGCKARDWDDPALLQQAGFSTSALGRRLTGVEPGERDQGQRDDRDDVLAVSTAGMLVRRDLLDALGGDAALPVLGEDLDLCRRAHLAGARVVVVAGAQVRHADATRSGLRDTPAARSVRWTARRHEAHARLAGAPALLLPLVALAVLAGAVGRALGRVAVKQPDRATGELTPALAALAHPLRVLAARQAAARTAALPRRSLRPLMVGRRDVWRWHRDRWAHTSWAPTAPAAPVGPVAPVAAVAPVDPDAGPGSRGLRALVPLLAALTVVGATALHRLLGAGQVSGGALAPAPGLGALWSAARSTWQAAGLGAAAPADPWLSVLAVLSLLTGGSPAAAVRCLLLLALPLAAVGAWAAAGAATRSVPLRCAAAVSWAGAAPLLLAVASGRLGPLAAHLALPWVALGTARAVTAPTVRRALSASAGAGLAACAVVAGAPVLLPALLVALLVVALTARRWTSALAWAALAPVVVTGPLLVPALGDARVLLAAPGLGVPGAAAPAWQQLLGVPAALAGAPGAGTWPVLLLVPGAVLALAALPALATRGRWGRASRTGWWVAGLGLAAAVAAGGAVVGLGSTGRAGTPPPAVLGWAGAGSSLVLLGLGIAALSGAESLRAARGRLGRVLAVACAVALLAPVALLGSWTWQQLGGSGGAGPVHRAPAAEPAVAVDGARSADAVRTLHLRLAPDGSATASLRRGALTLADASVVRAAAGVRGPAAAPAPAGPDPAAGALLGTAALLVTGGEDPRPQLADLGVGYVVVDAAPSAAGAAAASGTGTAASPLDAVPGLARAGATGAGTLYRVLPASGGPADSAPDRPSRARLLDARGAALAALASHGQDVEADLPPAAEGSGARTVVLAERADAGWRASLDGRSLRRTTHAGWAVAFEVPASGGHLEVTRSDPSAAAWTLLQGLVLLLTALLAVPVPAWGRRSS